MLYKKSLLSAIVLLITLVFPLILGSYLDQQFDPSPHLPLHATLEAAGAIMAFTVALFIYSLYKVFLVIGHMNWTAIALIAMGIFDMVHAFMFPGELFVWFHSLAVFAGGILFSLVWLKERVVSRKIYRLMPLLAIIVPLITVFISFAYASELPKMVKDGEFTSFAIYLNVIGGVGFIIAGLDFMRRYYKYGELDDLLFSGHTYLFGISGLLFATSYIWAPSWWLWHFLRLFAYLIALYYTYMLFSRKSEILHDEKRLLLLEVEENNQKILNQSDRLELLNKNLEKEVAREVAKNLDQERMMQRQARLVQMGEMISMIAHQWRQPLNALGLIAQKVQKLTHQGKVSVELIDKNVDRSMELIKGMSRTIDDFMDIAKNDTQKQLFDFQRMLSKVESLVSGQLEFKGIELIYNMDEPLEINSYKNEFFHVLLNLISNASDAFDDQDIDDKRIFITVMKDQNSFICMVKDTAGGIPKDLVDKVFNPYFTTKEQGKGTGLGLSMSKRIVEDLLDGTIEVHNNNEGAVFTIKIVLHKEETN